MPMARIQISPAQQVMFGAAQKVLQRDYAGALALYNQAVAMDGTNVQAYLQRGVVKREMHDEAGAQADAAAAIRLCNAALARDPQNAQLYHDRALGFRLLKDFAHAREDMQRALQLPGAQPGWKTDLRAIDLEEKFNG